MTRNYGAYGDQKSQLKTQGEYRFFEEKGYGKVCISPQSIIKEIVLKCFKNTGTKAS